MNENLVANQAILSIASAFERMNSFARSLREQRRFSEATTCTDIREYTNGWRCEKYVESVLDGQNGIVAAWAIEVYFKNDVWTIETNTSISYGDYDENVDLLEARTVAELGTKLEQAVANLQETVSSGAPFLHEIERYS